MKTKRRMKGIPPTVVILLMLISYNFVYAKADDGKVITISGGGKKITVNINSRPKIVNDNGNIVFSANSVSTEIAWPCKITFAEASEISISFMGKSTYCSEKDLDFSGLGESLKAYVATGFDPNSGTIWMTRVYDVPKGTGIFLIGDEGSYSIPTTASSSYYRNMLVGTLENTDIPSSTEAYTNYYLTVEDDELRFCKVAGNGRTMSANRAYLQIPNDIGSRPASASAVSEMITISELGKSTYCSENGLDFSGINGLKAYTATGYTHHSGTIWMTRVKDVPAGTGIFLLGNPGSYDVPTTTRDEQHSHQSYYENMLVGLVESAYVPSSTENQTNYYLTTEDGELKFCRIAGEGRTMSSHRAYLQIPSSILHGGTKGLKSSPSNDSSIGCCDEVIGVKLVGYGNSTGIREIVNSQDTNGDTYYNLKGQKVNRPGKGVYVINRKKVIVR